MTIMDDTNIIERVATLETEMKNVHDSNQQFREEVREEIKEIRKQNKSIYEIASSVKVMTQDIQGLRSDIKEVKADQKEMNRKMDEDIDAVKQEQENLRNSIDVVDHKEAKELLKFWRNMRDKLAWLAIGAVAAYFMYQLFPFLK